LHRRIIKGYFASWLERRLGVSNDILAIGVNTFVGDVTYWHVIRIAWWYSMCASHID